MSFSPNLNKVYVQSYSQSGSPAAMGPSGFSIPRATGFCEPSGFGATGATGFLGSSGFQGLTGFSGATGLGFSGSSGLTGFTGFRGLIGPIGFAGPSGFAGSTGFIGSTGFNPSSAFAFTGPTTVTITSPPSGQVVHLTYNPTDTNMYVSLALPLSESSCITVINGSTLSYTSGSSIVGVAFVTSHCLIIKICSTRLAPL
jgi:hypothetical protein